MLIILLASHMLTTKLIKPKVILLLYNYNVYNIITNESWIIYKKITLMVMITFCQNDKNQYKGAAGQNDELSTMILHWFEWYE